MPRQSAEARATLTAARAGKLAPTPGLSAAERRSWRAIVDATPAGHLTERDRPLLESFVSLTVAQRRLSQAVGKATDAALLEPAGGAARALDRISTIGKTLAAIANRLKIAPLSSHSAPHRAKVRDERPAATPLLGGLARVK